MRKWAAAAVALAVSAPGLGCAGSSTPSTPVASPTAPHVSGTLARRLTSTDAMLRASLLAWRASDPQLQQGPPSAALEAAAKERQIVHLLARHPGLARRTLSTLTGRLAAATAAEVAAARDLQRLTGGSPGVRLRLIPPRPAGELLLDYRLGERRFGVRWEVLAAVNLVESAFGRVVNRSSAGAQGPMQFLPATWAVYGLGGNIRSPHDAILAAANYLHQAGAPDDERRALYGYNPSRLYVRAVLTYADIMARDRLAYLTYYAWEASLPASPPG